MCRVLMIKCVEGISRISDEVRRGQVRRPSAYVPISRPMVGELITTYKDAINT